MAQGVELPSDIGAQRLPEAPIFLFLSPLERRKQDILRRPTRDKPAYRA